MSDVNALDEPAATPLSAKGTVVDGKPIRRRDPQALIVAIRQGIPASLIGNLSTRMGMSKELLL